MTVDHSATLTALTAAQLRARAIDSMRTGRPDDAIAAFDAAIAMNPQAPDLHANRGLALKMAQRPAEAADAIRTAMRFDPSPKLVTILSTCELMAGQFEEGWRHYEGRRDPATRYDQRGFLRPSWTGAEPVSGKRVLAHGEQGLGDTIMFSRYLALLRDRGADVLFAPQKALQQLMEQLDADMRIVEPDIEEAAFDLQVRLLSLPLAFGTTLTTIPAPASYLTADPARVAAWRAKIGEHGFKVGVTWQSSLGGVRAGRAFDPALLPPLGGVSGVRLISLQKPDADFPVERQRALGLEVPVPQFDTNGAFMDTAAMIECCDLVIACDGAVANLAGALGRPVWIALPFSCDWRWLTNRADSPWYSSVRLFRQPSIGAWPAVMGDLAEALHAERRHPH